MLVWVVCAVPLGWFTATSDWEGLATYAPWLLLVAWTVCTVLWLPRLIIRPDGLSVVNGLRTHWIPFSVMEDVNVGHSVSIKADGRNVVSWGAPMPRGAMAAGREVFAGSGIQTITPGDTRLRAASPADHVRVRIVQAWDKSKAQQTPGTSRGVVTRWNVLTVATGTVAIIAVAYSLMI
jgi:hypothetical protein